jgi:hypothetical protein
VFQPAAGPVQGCGKVSLIRHESHAVTRASGCGVLRDIACSHQLIFDCG